MKVFAKCLLFAVAVLSSWTPESMAEPPLDVTNKSQLVADRTWIMSTSNVDFKLHQGRKHPANPIVRADKPWEGWRLEIYGNVLYDADTKQFKMWYSGDATADFPNYATYYATSKDGIHWEKPILRAIFSATGNRDHNAVVDSCLLASVIHDAADPDESQRYKMICWLQKEKPEGGPHSFTSPDGIHWTKLSKEPLFRSNDVLTAFYHEDQRRYVAFPKHSTPVRGIVRRCFTVTTSEDFLTWTEPKYTFVPDLRDDAGSLARIEQVRPILDVPDNFELMRTEFYGLGFYVAESCTLAFPWVFSINNNARYGNHEGPGELQLAVSRDLENWDRSFREPVVPRGKVGEWDCGFFTTQSRALRVGDEVWLYYGGSNYTHGTPCIYREEGTGRGDRYTGSIGLVTWPLDRFVSADAGNKEGTVTTAPVRFNGSRLELNAATQQDGEIIVELLDLQSQVLATSKPVKGDGLRLAVSWSESDALDSQSQSPVTIRFRLTNASLFAFAIRDN